MRLEAGEIIATVERLEKRIAERFPNSGLRHLAGELGKTAGEVQRRVTSFGRPNHGLRAAIFLVTVERRIVRRRILTALEELRELAHIIDMHQLTKDPEGMGGTHRPTPSSPSRPLDPFLLVRYLDYCSEMLSLIAKLASVYAHDSKDSEVLGAIDNLDDLTTRLSLKIWQKIVILVGTSPV